jgi:hypothetical protein
VQRTVSILNVTLATIAVKSPGWVLLVVSCVRILPILVLVGTAITTSATTVLVGATGPT